MYLKVSIESPENLTNFQDLLVSYIYMLLDKMSIQKNIFLTSTYCVLRGVSERHFKFGFVNPKKNTKTSVEKKKASTVCI